MEYTDQQLAQFRAEFARRKRNQFLAAVPVIAIAVSVAFFKEEIEQAAQGISPAVLGVAVVLVFGGLVVFSLRKWRCPACDSYLGRSTSMHHCPKCGVALK